MVAPSVMGATYDYFLAHATEDRATAEQLHDSLEGRASVFFAARALRPGDVWSEEIARAQESSRATIVVVSQASDGAHYLQSEAHRAIELHRQRGSTYRVIPVVLDDVKSLPFGLNVFQRVDARGRTMEEVALAIVGSRPLDELTATDTGPGEPFVEPKVFAQVEQRVRSMGAVLLVGVPGVGKSTVAEHLCARLQTRERDIRRVYETDLPRRVFDELGRKPAVLWCDDPWGRYKLGEHAVEWARELAERLPQFARRHRGSVVVITSRRDLFEQVDKRTREQLAPFIVELGADSHDAQNRLAIVEGYLREVGASDACHARVRQHADLIVQELELPLSLAVFARAIANTREVGADAIYSALGAASLEGFGREFERLAGAWGEVDVRAAMALGAVLEANLAVDRAWLRNLADRLRVSEPPLDLPLLKIVGRLQDLGWIGAGDPIRCHPSVLEAIRGLAERSEGDRDAVLGAILSLWLREANADELERVLNAVVYRPERAPPRLRGALDDFMLERLKGADVDTFAERYRRTATWFSHWDDTREGSPGTIFDLRRPREPLFLLISALEGAGASALSQSEFSVPVWAPEAAVILSASAEARRLAEFYVTIHLAQGGRWLSGGGLAAWFLSLGWDLTDTFAQHLEENLATLRSNAVDAVVCGALPPGSSDEAFLRVLATLRKTLAQFEAWRPEFELELHGWVEQGLTGHQLGRANDPLDRRAFLIEATVGAWVRRWREEGARSSLLDAFRDDMVVEGWQQQALREGYVPDPAEVDALLTKVPAASRHRLFEAMGKTGDRRYLDIITPHLATSVDHLGAACDAAHELIGGDLFLRSPRTRGVAERPRLRRSSGERRKARLFAHERCVACRPLRRLLDLPFAQRGLICLAVAGALPDGLPHGEHSDAWMRALLRSESERAAFASVRGALSRRRAPRSVGGPLTWHDDSALRELASSSVDRVAIAAIASLRAFTQEHQHTITKACASADVDVRLVAIRCAHRALGPTALPLLVGLARNDPDYPCRELAIKVLCEVEAVDVWRGDIIACTGDVSPRVRATAAHVIGSRRWEDGLDRLLELLEDSYDGGDEPGDPRDRPVVRAALSALDPFATEPRVAQRLLDMVRAPAQAFDDEEAADLAVRLVLAHMDGEASAAALERAMAVEFQDHLEHSTLRRAAAHALCERLRDGLTPGPRFEPALWVRVALDGDAGAALYAILYVVFVGEPGLLARVAEALSERPDYEARLLLLLVIAACRGVEGATHGLLRLPWAGSLIERLRTAGNARLNWAEVTGAQPELVVAPTVLPDEWPTEAAIRHILCERFDGFPTPEFSYNGSCPGLEGWRREHWFPPPVAGARV